MSGPGTIRPLPPTGGPPRVRPGGVRELGPVNALITRIAGLGMGTTSPNLFATMGRHRRLFRSWLILTSRLMPRGRLPRRDTEVAILRVAHLRGATYEHQHHVRVGRGHGVDDEVVRRIHAGPDADGWSPRDSALLSAIDGLLAAGDLDDAAWVRLREHLDERDAIEFVVLVTQYDALATFLGTLRVAPDNPQPLRRRIRRVGRR